MKLLNPSILKLIAEYLKLIESLDGKVDKLIKNPLNTAILNLKYAQDTRIYSEKIEYVKCAKRKFIEAIDLEYKILDNADRIFAAYYGLALCQYLLKDFKSCITTLQKYADLDLKWSFRQQTIVQGRSIPILLIILVSSPILIPIWKLTKFMKIDVIDNSFNKVDQLTPFGLKQRKSLIEQDRLKAAEFAKEIEKIEPQNIFQKIAREKEQKFLQKLSEYFNLYQYRLD